MAKTQAEIQKDWRDRMKAKPLLERLGYPEVMSQVRKDLEMANSMIQELSDLATKLNSELSEIIKRQPDEPKRTKALAELQRYRNIKIKTF